MDFTDLKRNLLNALPAMLAAQPYQQDRTGIGNTGYVPGQAQTRMSHADAYILPPEQYDNAVRAYGKGSQEVGPEQAMTLNATPNAMDSVLNFLGLHASPLMQSAMKGPTIVAPQPRTDTDSPSGIDPRWSSNIRHEAVHALLHGADSKLNTMAVESLVPGDALVALSRYYNPQEISQEIPARAMTDPTSLMMYSDEGRTALRKYATMLETQGFKQQADKLRQYFNLTGKPQGIRDNTQSFQKPNDQF